MANFLKSVGDYVKSTAWEQPFGIVKDISKGDFKGAFNDWRHTFGQNERGESKIANSLGIRGWVGDHPGETAGAIVGSIFGGIYAAGAYGAGATATGAGASTAGTTTAASAGSAAGAGGATALPTATNGAAGATGASSGINWTQAISQMASAAPSGGQQQNQPAQPMQVQPLQSVARGFQPVNLIGTMAQQQPDYMNQINNILGGRNG